MSARVVRVSSEWLALREPADAAARASDLVEHLHRRRPADGRWVIHDLGCGTGSMARWLAPLLPGAQHWIVHDRDDHLLALAGADQPGPAADGALVTVEARRSDIARLRPHDLADATLITASALLDMLTGEELAALVAACAGPRCPVLLTLSVDGHVAFDPKDPLDRPVADAFNAHQRRATERGRLLGPAAVAFAVEEFGRREVEVLVRQSPWRLDAEHSDLTTEWLTGWLSAASEQQPERVPEIDGYRRRRLAQLAAGRVTVSVGHEDLLALPR